MTTVGYFINPDVTPLSQIDFGALKRSGISAVYIRATNSGSTIYTNLNHYYSKIVSAGISPFAWVWEGFSHAEEVTAMGFHTVMDLETYDMASYINEVEQLRTDTQGKTLIICTKADGWDGNQRWDLLAPLCDYLMPMLYLGDYNKSITDLNNYIKSYNTTYPGKIYPALETYVSDNNVVAKTNTILTYEIDAIKPYIEGLGLFRYGLSNFKEVPSITPTSPTSPSVTPEKPRTNIYVGPSTITPTTKSQIYGTYTAPFYSCTLTYTLFAANSVEFESPNYYDNMSRVNITGEHKSFGGQITENKETQNGYTYTCLDYNRLLFDKTYYQYNNIKISKIIKDLLAADGLPTQGIMETSTVHTMLAGSTATNLDIMHQLANIEGLEFLMNQDGIPILRETPQSTMGYVFVAEECVSDYTIDLNDTNVVTGIVVLGKDGELLYNDSNVSYVLKYGNLDDILEDSNITDTGMAKTAADKLFKDDNSGRWTNTITIPQALNIGEGEWCIFVPPKWSNIATKAYYTQEVQVKIDPSGEETIITCLDGKPPLPSNWIYVDPITNMATVCTTTAGGNPNNSICVVGKPSVGGTGLSYSNYASCFDNHCPGCGKDGTLHFNPKGVPEGELTCGIGRPPYNGCDRDYDATKGKIKMSGQGLRLTQLSGPTPSSRPVCEIPGSVTSSTTCTVSSTDAITGLAAKLPATVRTPCQLYQWIRDNVSYSYYWDSHHGESPTAAATYILANAPNGKANCDDQALAAVALLQGLGYPAQRVHATCSGMGHYNVIVNVNNVIKIFDTSCTSKTQIRGCAY
jgi:hypothetical protein